MRPHIVVAGLAAFLLTGAAAEHASKQDIDARELAVSQANSVNPDGAPVNQTTVSKDDPYIFEAIAACLKEKGYMRVQDIGDVCDNFILPQCFERN